jgi:capsular polysaccharide biosynthesis protein
MNAGLSCYLGVIRDGWRWIVWGALIALGLTTTCLLALPKTYSSDATVFVRTPGDVSQVVDGGDRYAQGRAKTYAALAGSPSVAARVIVDLGLDDQPDALAHRIEASNPPGTALIDVSVRASSAAEAQQIATVFLSEYGATVRQLESIPGSLVPRAELLIVDPPSRGARVVAGGLPITLVILGVALIGVVLGATAAALRSAFATRKRTPPATDTDPAQVKYPEEIS